jgi:hypothetical protein
MLHFITMPDSLNKIIGEGKRFMAKKIIVRLEKQNFNEVLDNLHADVKDGEKKKGQVHKVFKESFDAKECVSEKFIVQKLNYMHLNPVSKKWNLVTDYTAYEHSSAAYYENGAENRYLKHYRDI